MEANRQLSSSSEGVEISAFRGVGAWEGPAPAAHDDGHQLAPQLTPVREPPGYATRRGWGAGRGYGALMQEEGAILRRRTSSRSLE